MRSHFLVVNFRIFLPSVFPAGLIAGSFGVSFIAFNLNRVVPKSSSPMLDAFRGVTSCCGAFLDDRMGDCELSSRSNVSSLRRNRSFSA